MWRYGGVNQGLPFGNLTSCSISKRGESNETNLDSFEILDQGQIYWIGSNDGLALFNPMDRDYPWRIFQGYRWLAGEKVANIYQGLNDGVFVLTEAGLTFVYSKIENLESKSLEIEKVYQSGRHGRKDLGPNHPMNGLVSQIGLNS